MDGFFKYPNRVYVLYGDINDSQIQFLGGQLYDKDKKNRSNNGVYLLYQIDTRQLPKDVRFYGDPNYRYGYFTESNIPPQALSIVKYYDFGRG